MTLHFEWFGFADAARMALAHGLRKEVFVDEQGFSLEADRDEQDKNALHVLGLDETGAARCTARVFADAPGVWHAGRIAVQRGLRGQGVGRLLLADTGETYVPYVNLHCVVLAGWDGDTCTIADPLQGRRRVDAAAFLQCFRQMGSRAVVVH